MPLYEYSCEKCGRYAQTFHATFSDADMAKPPLCCKIKMKKLIGPANFILKGKDWPSKTFRERGQRFVREK